DSTYSVLLKFSLDKQGVEFELVYHSKNGGKTRVSTVEERVQINHLNKLLEEGTYTGAHDEMSVQAYLSILEYLRVSTSTGWYSGSLIRSLRYIMANLIKRR